MSKLGYYRTQGVKLMNKIEDETHKMMSELDKDLENEFWVAELCNDEKALKCAYIKLCALHDSVTMD